MKEILRELQKNGYCLIRNTTSHELQSIISVLGDVLFTTDVQVNTRSRALVTSDRELKLHTDHHAVKFITWYCHKQCSAGGESVLLDTQQLLPQLTRENLQALKYICAYEHKLFEDDEKQHPILTESVDGNLEIYYSYWLMDDDDRKNINFIKLKDLIDSSNPIKLKLNPFDALILDNKRVLHGRTAIQGDKDRHLTRYWIKP